MFSYLLYCEKISYDNSEQYGALYSNAVFNYVIENLISKINY